MVDTRALRARAANTACEFESRPRHLPFTGCNSSVECSVWDRDAQGSIPCTPTQREKLKGWVVALRALYYVIKIHMENQINMGDQNSQKISQDSTNKSKNLILNWRLIFAIVLFLTTVSVFTFNAIKKGKSVDNLSTLPQKTLPTPTQQDTETVEERNKKGMLEFFLTEYFNKYPKFQSEVKSENVRRVFPLALKKISENQGRGWLVEVEKESRAISHYLLTPIVEKELVDSMSCVSQDENPPIELERVETVGNEGGLGRDLQEKSGYLILSGTKNSCYGGANSGFISVYNMRSGEKIKLQGDFTTPGTIWKGVSKTGNALGILRGIYGINQPTIVVEYGNFKGAATTVEEVSLVAYFDLQTGKLKQLIKFE